MKPSRWRHPIGDTSNGAGSSTTLCLSSLSYASLTIITKVKIDLVDTLGEHLNLDAAHRRLSIFRVLTFCALNILGKSPDLIAECMLRVYSAGNEGKWEEMSTAQKMYDENLVQPYREVLMTYRLLFGQKKASRKLIEAELQDLRTGEKRHEYDVLLDTLCTAKLGDEVHNLPTNFWPVTCVSKDRGLQEQSEYSSQDDFPRFGQRLAKLQAFTLRQQPSKLTDLWRDRRNPLQWYTFWAVLISGGVSILLAFAQLCVGIAQLVIAILTLRDQVANDRA